MLQSQVRAGAWTLEQDGTVLACHSLTQPFVTAVKREKSYKENRGTYQETVTETARIPLTKVKREGEQIVFSEEGHRFSLRQEARPRGVRCGIALGIGLDET